MAEVANVGGQKDIAMSHGRGKLAACASVLVLGAALQLSFIDRVQSQPSQPEGPPAETVTSATAAPAFSDSNVRLMLDTLDQADAHGLPASEFDTAEIRRLLGSKSASERKAGEARLQRTIIAYAKAQYGGRLNVSERLSDWAIQPAAYNAEQNYAFALSQNRVAPWLASLAPPFERYRQLQKALGQYRHIAQQGGWEAIPEGPALKPGMTSPRVVALRKRLAAENAPGAIELTSPVYDPTLAAVVAKAQARYGLVADGVVGAGALAALNMPVEARMDQIRANMERWRWMPRLWPRDRIEVNIPSASLVVYDDNAQVEAMRVAVGKSTSKTPMLQSEIHSVVLNPPWNVPGSIASKELAPKGGAYLARNGFRWVSNGAGGARLQQRPGPGNSLGRVKFDFQNNFGVYLHDTNSRAVFERDARSVSHGCVRVERPLDLAALLLQENSDWDVARINATLEDTDTVRAPVGKSWNVMIMYWTVQVGDDGQVNFRPDVYDWDKALIKLLDDGRTRA